ncbi:MAG: hypothetical protein ACREAW_04965 [Nitrososphaera sp.]
MKALYAIAITLALMSFQSAFAEVGDISVSGVGFRDIGGCKNGGVVCGSQYMLTANVTNNSTQSLSYVAFLDLRDSEGVTQYLEFHKGRLDLEASSDIASSWTPDRPGEYELRVFVISDFENPKILSQIGINTTTIS